ncbi:MAG: glycosyltransferase family 2 protein [Planctomycetota bacterium]|jgi:GT2 family glycosyltransferase
MTQNKTKPEVSIIVLNLNGKEHLDRCFSSLREMDYDPGRVECILVDNGSIDGSVRYMSNRFPEVRVIANKQNLGFSMACNLGARAAQGEILVFLNNDMRVDKGWLAPLVEVIRAGEADCAASLILSWDGRVVNFGGAGSNFHGIGFQEGMNDPDLDKYRDRKEILFPCGGSMAIRRDLFLEVEGFDEDFFAYFEDVDFGWRLWVLGYRVLFVPESTVFHHHHGTSRLIDVHKIRVLYIRNPLYTIFKNYGHENLVKILSPSILLTLKRTVYLLQLTDRGYRMKGNEAFARGPLAEKMVKVKVGLSRVKVPRAGLADLVALNDFTDNFKRMQGKREKIQAARRRPDAEILPLFGNPFWAVETPEEYGEALHLMKDFFGLSEIFDSK